MLQSINDRIQGWLGWVIVGFISIPFALFGIQSYLEVDGSKFVAKVNDTEITPAAYDRALAQERGRLQEMFGKNMPKSDAYDNILKKQVIERLITTEVMNQYANEAGYTVADQSLSEAIRSIGAFKENGVFSQDLYEKVLRSQGMSIAGFESIYRQELSTSQIQNSIMGSAIVTAAEISQQVALNNQHRNISYIEFNAAKYIDSAKVTDEEAKSHFQQNAFRYMNPEQVSLQFIELKSEQLENEVPVNEDDIKQSYDDYVANAETNQQRKASHILVTLASNATDAEQKIAEEKINKVKSELAAGAAFSDLAKKYSDDEGSVAGGGDLGLVSKGMMVKPFEDSLFALKTGEVSDVVRSEFGFHIIKLNEIQSAKIETFEDKRASIEKDLKESGVQNLFFERAELLANLAYENPESLDLAADQLKLQVQTTTLFTRANGTGIAANAKVRNTAFENAVLNEKLNSDAIEITNKHVVVIRVADHKPTTSKDFAEVKASIVAELKQNKSEQMAKADATKIFTQVESDNSSVSWNTLMAAHKANAKALNLVKRDSDKANRQLIQTAFKLTKPESGKVSFKQVALNNGNAAIVAVTAVKAIKADTDTLVTDTEKRLTGQISGQEFSAVIAAIKQNYDIVIPAENNE